jgi:hypothetical protein
LDSVNAQAEMGQQALKFAGKGLGALKNTSLGKKLLGIASYPLIGAKALAKKQAQLTDEYGDIALTQKDKEKKQLSPLEKIRQTVIEKFSIGDLISGAGLGMYLIQNNLGPEKPGIIGGLFKNLSLLMTFFGSTSAAIGRALGFDKEFMYGEEQALQMLQEAESQNKPIFKIKDGANADHKEAIDTYIKNAKKLDKTLIYKDGLRESILERHEQNQIGGIFDGPPGTGKTQGVECIIGKWADKVQREGDIPVIAELNLANFDEYVTQQKQKQQEAIEFFEYFTDSKENTKGNFATNQGLMVLELLIRKIQRIKNNVEKYNENTEGPKKRLVVFADEFDKAIQARTLKGCDRTRLKNLLIQFNELFVNQELLLTSNTKLEKMMKELEEHVKIDANNTGKEEVIDPMYDRLSAKNRALVEFPGPREQALIIASRILFDYPNYVDWKDFGADIKRTGSFEYDREQFANILETEVTGRLQTKINGRQLFNACEQLKSMLLGKARQINVEKQIFNDEAWSKMSAKDKIEKTGALIDKYMVRQVVESKLQNMNLNQSQKDQDLAFKLVDAYMKNPAVNKKLKAQKVKLSPGAGADFDNVLASVYSKNINDSNTTYVATEPVEFDGGRYQHILTQYPNADGSGSSFSVAFAKMGNKAATDLKMSDFVQTKRIADAKIADEIVPIVNRAAKDPLQKAVDSLINAFATAGTTGKVNLKEEDVNTIAKQFVEKALAA